MEVDQATGGAGSRSRHSFVDPFKVVWRGPVLNLVSNPGPNLAKD